MSYVLPGIKPSCTVWLDVHEVHYLMEAKSAAVATCDVGI